MPNGFDVALWDQELSFLTSELPKTAGKFRRHLLKFGFSEAETFHLTRDLVGSLLKRVETRQRDDDCC